MEAFEAYRSPSVKAEPRWGGRDDTIDRPLGNENYRSRRSPGKTSLTGQFNCVDVLCCGPATMIFTKAYNITNPPFLHIVLAVHRLVLLLFTV